MSKAFTAEDAEGIVFFVTAKSTQKILVYFLAATARFFVPSSVLGFLCDLCGKMMHCLFHENFDTTRRPE
jgi:hypothetical protein